ncbi:MAG: hypothetical protein KBA26_03550 [Candidatus Delongbacteria bacterium]|nr:hypothetical protein [Candidatus Delongbacteria bacterium]
MNKRIIVLLTLLIWASVSSALKVYVLEIKPGQCGVTLEWAPYEYAGAGFEYVLFRSLNPADLNNTAFLSIPANAVFSSASDTFFIDNTIQHDSTYYYKVVGYKNGKLTVEYNTAVESHTGDCRLDAGIAGLTVKDIQETQVTLSWSYTGRISDIDYAELYYATATINDSTLADPIRAAGNLPADVTERVVSGLEINRTYYFQLVIHDPVGYQARSEIKSAKTQFYVNPVEILSGRSLKNGVVELNWSYPASQTEDIRRFQVWRSIQPRVFSTGAVIATLDSNARSYTDNSTNASIPDTLYYYTIMPISIYGDLITLGNKEVRLRSDRLCPPTPGFLKDDWGYHKGITDTVSWNLVKPVSDSNRYSIAWYPDGGSYQAQDTIHDTLKIFETRAGRIYFALVSLDSLGNSCDTTKSVIINDILAPKTTVACHSTDSGYTIQFPVTFTVEDKLASNLSENGSGVAKSILKYKIENPGTGQVIEDSLDSFISGTQVNVYQLSNQADSCRFQYGIYAVDKVGNVEALSGYTCGPYKFINRQAPRTSVICLKDTVYTQSLKITFTAKDSLGSEPSKIAVDHSILKYKIQNLFNPASVKEGELDPFVSGGILPVWSISEFDSCLVWYGVYSIDKDGDVELLNGFSCGPYKVINKRPPVTEVTCLKDTLYSKTLSITFAAQDVLGSQPDKIAVDHTVLKYKIQDLFSSASIIEDSLDPFVSEGTLDVWTRSGYDSCRVWYGAYSIDKDGDIEEFGGYSCGPYKMINTRPAAPVITHPDGDGICKNDPVIIRWNLQANVDYYEIQQSSNSQFASDTVSQRVSVVEAGFTPPVDNRVYYYRVRSKNLAGISDYSTVRYLLYDNTAPSIISLLPAGSPTDTVFFRASEFPVFTVNFDDSVDVGAVSVELIDAFNTADDLRYSMIKSPAAGMKNQISLAPAAGIPQHSLLQLGIGDLKDCAGNINDHQYTYLYETYLEYDKGGVVRKHLIDEPLTTIDVKAGSFDQDMRLHIHLENPPVAGSYKLVPDEIEPIAFLEGKNVFYFSARNKDGAAVTQLTQPAEFKLFVDGSVGTSQMVYIYKRSKTLNFEGNEVWERIDTLMIGVEEGKPYVKTWITDLTDRYAVIILNLPKDRLDYAHNFPNPFDPRTVVTTFRFSLEQAGSVTIDIYDFFGGKVNSLQAGGVAGINEVTWNGRNGQGDVIADGGYMAFIKSAGKTEKVKVAVLKK